MRSVLKPCNSTRTRPDPQNSQVRVGLQLFTVGSARLNFRLSCSPLIAMAFALRTRKSERSQRWPCESCVRDRDNKKPIIILIELLNNEVELSDWKRNRGRGFRNKLNKGNGIDVMIHKFVRISHAFTFVAKNE